MRQRLTSAFIVCISDGPKGLTLRVQNIKTKEQLEFRDWQGLETYLKSCTKPRCLR